MANLLLGLYPARTPTAGQGQEAAPAVVTEDVWVCDWCGTDYTLDESEGRRNACSAACAEALADQAGAEEGRP
jgi:hypothetical protein